MTKLSARIPAAAAPATAETRLAAVLAGASTRALVDVEVPGTGLVGKMRLLEHQEEEQITFAVAQWMRQKYDEHQVSDDLVATASAGLVAAAHRHVLALAIAVRDPDDPSKPLGTAADWARLNKDTQIGPVWDAYQDLLEQLDPLDLGRLDAADATAMLDALKKKDTSQLLSFGAKKLCALLLASEKQPAP